ncbi:MAG: beta-lactamase family protein [Deltaproteobacteria bacterium]|nr:beta-lactamase family protein [Deltaproteobacteria bacterium]
MSTKKIDQAFQEALTQGVFPGAAVAVGNSKKTLFKNIYGLAEKIPLTRKLNAKTFFDIASLTKVVSTTTLAMLLNEKGLLDLDQPASKYFTPWKKEPYSQILIRHLLQHNSGLAAYKPYFENFIPKLLEGESREEIRKAFIYRILKETLEQETGALKVYSDLGFILLGEILEKITEKPLEKLFQDLIAKPLGLKNTFFVKLGGKNKLPPRTEFASTMRCGLRRKILAGEVDDEHAWMLGGIAGHAGLFSTLADLSLFAEEILKVDSGKSKFLKRETFRRFVEAKPKMGWDFVSPQSSQSGSLFSKDSIGHLGFTGTSLWIDLERKFYVVLLTNRVHPNRYNEGIKTFRPMIHDLLLQQLKLVK